MFGHLKLKVFNIHQNIHLGYAGVKANQNHISFDVCLLGSSPYVPSLQD